MLKIEAYHSPTTLAQAVSLLAEGWTTSAKSKAGYILVRVPQCAQ